jgi:DNA-directed RNA polymerase subunit RPC12/RpoP
MDIRKVFGIKYAVIDEQGVPHCPNCTTNLTGVPAPARVIDPIRCPSCRTKIFPDLRGSGGMFKSK